MCSIILTKFTQLIPAFQIFRTIQFYMVRYGQYHYPLFGLFMPGYFGITEIFNTRIFQYWILLIFFPGSAIIYTIGHALCLIIVFTSLLSFCQMISKNSNHRWIFSSA